MNNKVIEQYLAIAHNHNLPVILNSNGKIFKGYYFDISNVDLKNNQTVHSEVFDRINSRCENSIKDDLLHLKNVQILFNDSENYISLPYTTIGIDSISSISLG